MSDDAKELRDIAAAMMGKGIIVPPRGMRAIGYAADRMLAAADRIERLERVVNDSMDHIRDLLNANNDGDSLLIHNAIMRLKEHIESAALKETRDA